MRVGARGFAIQVSSDQNGSGRATAGPLLLRFGTALETPISRLCRLRARAGEISPFGFYCQEVLLSLGLFDARPYTLPVSGLR